MSYAKTQGKTLNLKEKYWSNGTELIPAEVQANIRYEDARSVDAPFVIGYTVDDEGLLNNSAIEPDNYPSDYPSPHQQQRYIFLGAGATLFVISLTLISFAIS